MGHCYNDTRIQIDEAVARLKMAPRLRWGGEGEMEENEMIWDSLGCPWEMWEMLGRFKAVGDSQGCPFELAVIYSPFSWNNRYSTIDGHLLLRRSLIGVCEMLVFSKAVADWRWPNTCLSQGARWLAFSEMVTRGRMLICLCVFDTGGFGSASHFICPTLNQIILNSGQSR